MESICLETTCFSRQNILFFEIGSDFFLLYFALYLEILIFF